MDISQSTGSMVM